MSKTSWENEVGLTSLSPALYLIAMVFVLVMANMGRTSNFLNMDESFTQACMTRRALRICSERGIIHCNMVKTNNAVCFENGCEQKKGSSVEDEPYLGNP